MPTPQEIFDKRDKFLEKREAVLNRKVAAAERKLLDEIVDQFLDRLETSKGVIVNNGENIELTQAIDLIFAKFDRTLGRQLIDGYIQDIQLAQNLNRQYFQFFEDNQKVFARVSTKVQTTVRNRLGITKYGSIKRSGYLDNFLKGNPGKQDVLEIATKAITGEQSKAQARKQLALSVAGDENVSGKLAGYYRTFINDTYQQVDNLESQLYADAIGMQAAYYLGGTIKTTRKFCRQRNGLLYTDKEMATWSKLKWQGKNKNYDPFTDMGGYNCRHRFRYISNKQAARNREDLELTEDGKLVYKPGASKKGPRNQIADQDQFAVERGANYVKGKDNAKLFLTRDVDKLQKQFEEDKQILQDTIKELGQEGDTLNFRDAYSFQERKQGWNKPVSTFGDGEARRAINSSDEIVIFRGYGDTDGGYQRQFIAGEASRTPQGVYGNGYYFGGAKGGSVDQVNFAIDIAETYAGPPSSLTVTKKIGMAIIKKDARIINEKVLNEMYNTGPGSTLRKLRSNLLKADMPKEQKAKLDQYAITIDEQGAYAASLGYDIIKVDGRPKYYIVLNRTAIKHSAKQYTPQDLRDYLNE